MPEFIKDMSASEFADMVSQNVVRDVLNALQNPISDTHSLNAASQNDEFWTRKEAAAFLKISLVTLGKLVKQGKLKAYGLGTRHIRFLKSELIAARENL